MRGPEVKVFLMEERQQAVRSAQCDKNVEVSVKNQDILKHLIYDSHLFKCVILQLWTCFKGRLKWCFK